MDYKEKLKTIINSNKTPFVDIDTLLKYFPELKESEDERIRKALIEGFNKLDKSAIWYNCITNGQILSWLEKQGEQKPAEEYNITGIGSKHAEGKLAEMIKELKPLDAILEKQDEQKPVEPQQDMLSQEKYAKAVDECIYGEQKPIWSKEDELMLNDIITCNERHGHITVENITWLKSLKDRVQLKQ